MSSYAQNDGGGDRPYDPSADLRLHDGDELDPLDASCEDPEPCRPADLPTSAVSPLTYDFAADLILHDEQEDEWAGSQPCCAEVKPGDDQPLTNYDYSADLRLKLDQELPGAAGCEHVDGKPAAAALTPTSEAPDELREIMPVEPALILMQAADAVESNLAYNSSRDLAINEAEEELWSEPSRARHAPGESGAEGSVAAGLPSGLAAAAAEADSALATKWASARGNGTSRRGRSFRGQRAGTLSWLLRLESWLALASLSLFFQLFPAAFWRVTAVVDVRNWTWGVWVGVEIAVIGVLLLLKVRQAADA